MAAKDKEKALAKELYFHTSKTQKEIAEIVGVSERTLSMWQQDGNWDALKSAMELTPERVVNDLYAELEEINKSIKSRPEGQRFANAKEADARRKIIASIRDMHRQVSLPQYVQVVIALLEHLQVADLELAKRVNTYANEFLMEKSTQSSKV